MVFTIHAMYFLNPPYGSRANAAVTANMFAVMSVFPDHSIGIFVASAALALYLVSSIVSDVIINKLQGVHSRNNCCSSEMCFSNQQFIECSLFDVN